MIDKFKIGNWIELSVPWWCIGSESEKRFTCFGVENGIVRDVIINYNYPYKIKDIKDNLVQFSNEDNHDCAFNINANISLSWQIASNQLREEKMKEILDDK